MFIMTNQYDAGRIYRVINPDDCPLVGGDGAIVCDAIEESQGGDACVCGLSVIVSRAKTIPRTWKHKQPGIQNTEVQWNKEHEVFVRIFDDDDDDDEWCY